MKICNRAGLLASSMLIGVGMSMAAGGAAFAQEEEGAERIIVTGSRIADSNLTAPTAVTTINSAAIELSGLVNTADILRTVPSFGVSALSTNNSNFFTAQAGVNTLELRNLDEDRTLVLVNGRRYVSGLPGSAAVDFNTVPTALIDRVEVITGGASAIYGSDALAGVVNVILKDNFEGVEAGYQYGESAEGDDVTHLAFATVGGNFDGGRGNAVVSVTYSQEGGVLARDRENTRVDDIATCVLTGVTADCTTPTEDFFSSFSEFGRFFVPSTGDSFTVGTGTGPTGTVVPWSTAQFGFNRQHFRRISVPTDRYLISSLASYEIMPDVEAFMETTFANTETNSELEPFPHSSSDAFVSSIGIPVDNPFVPQAIRDAVIAAGDSSIPYSRRMTEIGQRGAVARRDTFRFLTGLRGELMDTYDWEVFYGQGQTHDNQQGGGQVNVANIREALNVIDVDGDPNTLEDVICANPAAVAEGCVPLNLFGLGSISPAAAGYISAPTQRQATLRQEIAGATISGPAFALPAGDVNFAAGLEWRREDAKDVPDALTQTGQNAGNKEEPVLGSFSVAEVFAEVEVPIITNQPLFYDLSVGGAYRYSDYSTLGETDAYTARVSWAPVEPLRFRAQYARAVRAPNIGELFAPGGENFAPVADPCNGVTAASTGTVAENCLSVPEIAARVAATGSFTLSQTEIQGTGGFTSKGNPLLQSETADTYSIGAVWSQDLSAGQDIVLSIDYFNIEIQDMIDTVARQQSLDLCFQSPSFPNQFCSAIVRDTTGPAFQLGEIIEANSTFLNEGKLLTSGVDVSFAYNIDLASLLGGNLGLLSLRGNYTYLIDLEETKFGVTDDLKGETGASEHEAQVAALYSQGPFTFQWETTYIGDAKPDNDPNSLFYFDVGTFVTHDIQAGWDINNRLKLYAGVNNLFDEDAPIILSGVPGNVTGTDTDANVYDPIGRGYYAGLRVRY